MFECQLVRLTAAKKRFEKKLKASAFRDLFLQNFKTAKFSISARPEGKSWLLILECSLADKFTKNQ